MKLVEVDLAGPPQMDSMLVAALAFLGRGALLLIKVDRDACLSPVEASTRPKLSVLQ